MLYIYISYAIYIYIYHILYIYIYTIYIYHILYIYIYISYTIYIYHILYISHSYAIYIYMESHGAVQFLYSRTPPAPVILAFKCHELQMVITQRLGICRAPQQNSLFLELEGQNVWKNNCGNAIWHIMTYIIYSHTYVSIYYVYIYIHIHIHAHILVRPTSSNTDKHSFATPLPSRLDIPVRSRTHRQLKLKWHFSASDRAPSSA